MPIKHTSQPDSNGKRVITFTHIGRVVDVRTFVATRNHSDTLDYSDFRSTQCTEALVYNGRTVPQTDSGFAWIGNAYLKSGEPIPLESRFGWRDCTNLFCWRGADFLEPTVDANMDTDAEMAEDFAWWQGRQRGLTFKDLEKRAADAVRARELEAERERNRPVKGKKMVVARGRKVKPGFEGTVAFVSGDRVLLKAHDKWQDRKADGVWVSAAYLKAV